jgi:glycosyltransferase involved in cell wall biosynthesis
LQLLIAVPVFNERKYVAQVIHKIRQYHDQVLVVDDGSTDGTLPVLRQLADDGQIRLIEHPENRGYGQSLIDAFAYAQQHGIDWVLTMDCDEQHEPERIPDFIRAIAADDADIISGSRYMAQFDENDLPPGDRRTINATITSLLNELFDLNLTDAFCGFKAHRMSAMARLELDVTGYAFPMQLWPQVVAAGLRVKEIPVRLIYNDPTRHFGGMLDNAECRLKHYLHVLKQETIKLGQAQAAQAVARRVEKLNCPKEMARALGLVEV